MPVVTAQDQAQEGAGLEPREQAVDAAAAAAVAPGAEAAAPAPTPSPEPVLAGTGARESRIRSLVIAFGVGAVGGLVIMPAVLWTGGEAPRAASTQAAPAQSASADAPAAPTPSASASASAAPAPPPVWRVQKLEGEPGVEVTHASVGKRAVHAALLAAGVSKGEAHRIEKAFEGKKRLDRPHVHDSFVVAREKSSGKVVAFEYATSPFDVWQAKADESGELAVTKLDLAVETVKVAKGLVVGDDLRSTVTGAGLDDDVLKMLDDALEGHAELSDLRPGARLRIVATEERCQGEFARYASLDAVEYFPANPKAPPVRIYWFSRDGSHKNGGYFDAKGRQPYHGGWRSPVPFARVSSRFNPNRMHPVLHVVMPHTGVDFGASTGTPVYATSAGVVASVGDGGACGNMVQIHHPNGLVSGYCHLSRFAAGLHAGQHVEARQLIAYVGATGRVTGPHLHFFIKRGETFIDPLTLRLDGVRVLPAGDRDDFAARREELDAELEAIALPAATNAPPRPEVAAGEAETFYEEPP